MNQQLMVDEPEDVLKEGWLYKVMVLFGIADSWPGWLILLMIPVWAGMTAVIWLSLHINLAASLSAAVILLLALCLDALLLISLPRRGLSFGPWKSQFVLLGLLRTSAALTLAVLGWLAGGWVALAALLVLQVGGTAAAIWGYLVEPFRVGLSEWTMTTDRLPADARPFRILHITDLHMERLTKRETAVLQLVQQTSPDLILITGDYVSLSYNKDPITHQQVRQFLQKLHAPYGVFATLGSITVDLREQVVPIFDGLHIPLMRQEWQVVDLGEGRQVVLLGMDCTHHLPTDRARLANLHASAPNGVPQILLYHSPELMPEAAGYGIDLYLCGHTHGGQVRLPIIGPVLTSSQLGRRYVMGLYKEARTHLYVSRGLGLEGMSAPRVRFLAPPEITLITVRSK